MRYYSKKRHEQSGRSMEGHILGKNREEGREHCKGTWEVACELT